MKSAAHRFRFTALLLGLLAPLSSLAQQDDEGGKRGEPAVAREMAWANTPPGKERPSDPNALTRRPGERTGASEARARRQVVQLTRLRAAMSKRLHLTRDQEGPIGHLFREYLRTLKGIRSRLIFFGADPGEIREVKELRAKLRKARKTGDEGMVRELRGRVGEKMRAARQGATGMMLHEFLGRVEELLSEEQRPLFQKLVNTLNIDRTPRYPRSGRLRALWRAAMGPEAGLSDDQRRRVSLILREGIGSVLKAEREGNPADEIAAKARDDALNELSPDQRLKVEAALHPAMRRFRAPGAGERIGPSHRGPRREGSTGTDADIDSGAAPTGKKREPRAEENAEGKVDDDGGD